MVKRDMRRQLEKDSGAFLQAPCRVLKECSEGPGAAYAADLLWSSSCLFATLVDPKWMPLGAAIALAKLWIRCEPLLDIKLLHIGFPSDLSAVSEPDMARARGVLAIVRELPAERHILLPLGESAAQPGHAGAPNLHGPPRPRQQQPGMGSQAVGGGRRQRSGAGRRRFRRGPYSSSRA